MDPLIGWGGGTRKIKVKNQFRDIDQILTDNISPIYLSKLSLSIKPSSSSLLPSRLKGRGRNKAEWPETGPR